MFKALFFAVTFAIAGAVLFLSVVAVAATLLPLASGTTRTGSSADGDWGMVGLGILFWIPIVAAIFGIIGFVVGLMAPRGKSGTPAASNQSVPAQGRYDY